MKKFSVAGVSVTPRGLQKIRFANDITDRTIQLDRKGHQDIRLIDFGKPLTKAQAVAALLDHPQFQDPMDQYTILGYADRNRRSLEEDHFAHQAIRAALAYRKAKMEVTE